MDIVLVIFFEALKYFHKLQSVLTHLYAVVGTKLESEISCKLDEHKTVMEHKLISVTFDYLVMNFTKSVNRFLHGNNIGVEHTNRIEEEAKMFHKKKKNIGKYCAKVEVHANDTSTNSVEKGKNEKGVNGKSAVDKLCDNKPNKSLTEGVTKKSVIQTTFMEKSRVKVGVTKSCEKQSGIKNSPIRKGKNRLAIKKIKPVISGNVNKNSSVHTMQLRRKT